MRGHTLLPLSCSVHGLSTVVNEPPHQYQYAHSHERTYPRINTPTAHLLRYTRFCLLLTHRPPPFSRGTAFAIIYHTLLLSAMCSVIVLILSCPPWRCISIFSLVSSSLYLLLHTYSWWCPSSFLMEGRGLWVGLSPTHPTRSHKIFLIRSRIQKMLRMYVEDVMDIGRYEYNEDD